MDTPHSAQTWASHPRAAPTTSHTATGYSIAANGTRTLSGGWQLALTDIEGGATYRMSVDVRFEALGHWRDALQCRALWGSAGTDTDHGPQQWDYLVPEYLGEQTLCFSRVLRAPANVDSLTLRYTLRWTPSGTTLWSAPRIERVPEQTAHPTRIAVVTGTRASRQQNDIKHIADNVAFYAERCRACATEVDLIVLPEVALQWQVPGHPLDTALACPGPETDVFAHIAQQHNVHILLGLFQREGDAVRNSAVLIDESGSLAGCYDKVHLAVGGESESGILPGDAFPIFHTPIGRIGCNICMDISAAESARMVGLNGADFLLLPIMGDHRADRWSPGPPVFHEERWRAIMRTRALDGQFTLVAARNEGQGSCIVDRRGDFLAYNDGTQEIITACVPDEDGYRTWNGGDFRGINWMQRRPHVYRAYTDESNSGPLQDQS